MCTAAEARWSWRTTATAGLLLGFPVPARTARHQLLSATGGGGRLHPAAAASSRAPDRRSPNRQTALRSISASGAGFLADRSAAAGLGKWGALPASPPPRARPRSAAVFGARVAGSGGRAAAEAPTGRVRHGWLGEGRAPAPSSASYFCPVTRPEAAPRAPSAGRQTGDLQPLRHSFICIEIEFSYQSTQTNPPVLRTHRARSLAPPRDPVIAPLSPRPPPRPVTPYHHPRIR